MNAIKIVLASALISVAVIKAAPALAEPVGPVAVSVVRTSDLDLSTREGQRQLDQRVSRVARELCGSASDWDLQGKNAARECRAAVIAEAQEQRERLLVTGESRQVIAFVPAR